MLEIQQGFEQGAFTPQAQAHPAERAVEREERGGAQHALRGARRGGQRAPRQPRRVEEQQR